MLASILNQAYLENAQRNTLSDVMSGITPLGPLNDLVIALLMHDEIYSISNSISHQAAFNLELPIKEIDLDSGYVKSIVRYVKEVMQPPGYNDEPECLNEESLSHFYRYVVANINDEELDMSTNFYSRFQILLDTNAFNVLHNARKTQEVKVGPIEYSIIAHQLGLSYYPSQRRSRYMNAVYDFQNEVPYTRRAILKYVDSLTKEFYAEVNAVIGKPYVSFKIPLLLDYVYGERNSSILNAAVDMRNTKAMQDFRKWMTSLDESVQSGDWVEYNNCMTLVAEIFENIKKQDRSMKKELEFSIAWLPCINVPFTMKYDTSKTRRLGSVFLHDYMSFAIRGRKLPY